MQTHSDADSPLQGETPELEKLRIKAEQMSAEGTNTITAGKPGERVLAEWWRGKFFIRHLPDDPLALRISIGEARHVEERAYLVFRGEPKKILALLEGALSAMQEL